MSGSKFDDFAEHVIGLRDGGQPIPTQGTLATQFGVDQGRISQWYARLVNDGRWEARASFDDFAEHVISLRDGGQPIPTGVALATQFGVHETTISLWYARLVNDGRWELPQRPSFDDFAEHVIGLRDGGQPIPKSVELATQFGVTQGTISQWYARLVNDGRWEPRKLFDNFAEHVIGLRNGGQPIPTGVALATQFGVSQGMISKWYARLVNDGRWEPRAPFDDFAEHVIGLRDGGQPIPKRVDLATQFGVTERTIWRWYTRLVNEGRWELPQRSSFDDFADYVIGLRDGGQRIPTQETLATQFGVSRSAISQRYARLVNDDRWELPQQAALEVIAGESPAAGVVNIEDWKPGMMVPAAEIIGALDDERATLVLDRGFARSVPQLVHLNIDNPGLSNDAKRALKGIPDGMHITIHPNGSLTVLPQSQAQSKKNDSSSPKKTTGGRRL